MKSLAKNYEAMELLKKLCDENFTDKKIQERLQEEFGYKWGIETIGRCRRNAGFSKYDVNSTPEAQSINKPIMSTSPPSLNDSEKEEWFRNQFRKTHLYKRLKRNFKAHEVEDYLEEYGQLCAQFEDIVVAEFWQIDDYLRHRILIERQLHRMTEIEKEINKTKKWIDNHPVSDDEHEMDDDVRKELGRMRVEHYRRLESLFAVMKDANERYDKLVYSRQKIMEKLSATRKDRKDELKGGKKTFFELVSHLQDSNKEREKQGRYAEFLKIAAEDAGKEFRKSTQFDDGEIDPVILDSESVLEDSVDG